MDKIQQIEAEIKRRLREIPKKETDKRLRAVYGGVEFELMGILEFIDSLPEDNPSEDLEKEQPQEPKTKGWVARWKDSTKIFVFDEKPFRLGNEWHSETERKIRIPQYSFPDLTWDDEPIEVELEIHRV